jgi:hypothetical protein
MQHKTAQNAAQNSNPPKVGDVTKRKCNKVIKKKIKKN